LASLNSHRLATSVDQLYEAALTPALWPDALSALAAAAGGFAANIVYAPPETRGWIISSPELAAALPSYAAGNWAAHNFRIERSTPELMTKHHVVTEATFITPREMERQPIQAGFFKPHGMRDFIGFELLPGEMLVGLERGQNPAADWERAALGRALPHFRRIGRLAQARGQARTEGAMEAFSQLNHAAMFLDRHGLIIHQNAAAETLIPKAFQITAGALRPHHRPSETAVQALITAATSPFPPHETPCLAEVIVPCPAGGRLILQAAPLAGAAQDMFRRAKAMVLVVDPGRAVPIQTQQLQRLFGLTTAEARIAQRLVQGEDLSTIATALAISRPTARTHLARIFGKTGTRRQAELAALLTRILVRLGGWT
jgi:DNA-binding CsgD family transcriptional regulator